MSAAQKNSEPTSPTQLATFLLQNGNYVVGILPDIVVLSHTQKNCHVFCASTRHTQIEGCRQGKNQVVAARNALLFQSKNEGKRGTCLVDETREDFSCPENKSSLVSSFFCFGMGLS